MLRLLRVSSKMLAAASITFALGTVAPATALAVDIFTSNGGTLVALFSSTDPSGCVSTWSSTRERAPSRTRRPFPSPRPRTGPS